MTEATNLHNDKVDITHMRCIARFKNINPQVTLTPLIWT